MGTRKVTEGWSRTGTSERGSRKRTSLFVRVAQTQCKVDLFFE